MKRISMNVTIARLKLSMYSKLAMRVTIYLTIRFSKDKLLWLRQQYFRETCLALEVPSPVPATWRIGSVNFAINTKNQSKKLELSRASNFLTKEWDYSTLSEEQLYLSPVS